MHLSPSAVILPKRLCPLVFALRGKGKAGRGRLLVLAAEASNERSEKFWISGNMVLFIVGCYGLNYVLHKFSC